MAVEFKGVSLSIWNCLTIAGFYKRRNTLSITSTSGSYVTVKSTTQQVTVLRDGLYVSTKKQRYMVIHALSKLANNSVHRTFSHSLSQLLVTKPLVSR